ncbi:MAG TPA: hypothetical protein VF733_05160 [Candidatus Saccharimonadales bacterium]
MAEISDDAYEKLRLILEKQYGQKFTSEEAKKLAMDLSNFTNYS